MCLKSQKSPVSGPRSLVRRRLGQSTVEYFLLLALFAVVAVAAFMARNSGFYDKVKAKLASYRDTVSGHMVHGQ